MPEDQAHQFAARLKELREQAGQTQQQLGERAGIHKLTVAKLEQGIREPSWATVQALAAALGVSCEAFAAEVQNSASNEKRPPGRPAKAAMELDPAEKQAATKKPGGKQGKK